MHLFKLINENLIDNNNNSNNNNNNNNKIIITTTITTTTTTTIITTSWIPGDPSHSGARMQMERDAGANKGRNNLYFLTTSSD